MKTKKIILNERYCQRAILMLLMFVAITTTMYGQEAANEIKSLWSDQIQPVIDVVLMIGVTIIAIWLFFQSATSKKDFLKNVGYVLGGAVILRVLTSVIGGIVDKDLTGEIMGMPIPGILQLFMA
jgi:hypothetical protein